MNLTPENGAGDDFLGDAPRTVTFMAGTDSRTVLLPTVNDNTYEEDGIVRLTLVDGSDYDILTAPLNMASVAVSSDDVPVVSVSGAEFIHEGDTLEFTVSSDIPLSDALTVNVSRGERSRTEIAQSDDGFVASGMAAVSQMPVVIAADSTNAAVFQIPTINHRGVKNGHGHFRAQIWCIEGETGCQTDSGGHPGGYTGQSPYSYAGTGDSREHQIQIREVEPPVISVMRKNTEQRIMPGENAEFIVRASSFIPFGGITVGLGTRDDPLASVISGTPPASVRFDYDKTSPVLSSDVVITTQENTGDVIVSVEDGTGYTVADAPDNEATVTSFDPRPTVGISADRSYLLEGDEVRFAVSLSEAPGTGETLEVVVTVTDVPGSDFVATGEQERTFTFNAGETVKTHVVTVVEDTMMEDDGDITATITTPGTTAYRISPAEVSARVTDDDTERPFEVTITPRVNSSNFGFFTLSYKLTNTTGVSVSGISFTHDLFFTDGLINTVSGSIQNTTDCVYPDGNDTGDIDFRVNNNFGLNRFHSVTLGTSPQDRTCTFTIRIQAHLTGTPTGETSNLTSRVTRFGGVEFAPPARVSVLLQRGLPEFSPVLISNATVSEDDGQLNFDVVLDRDAGQEVTVGYDFNGGSATYGADFTVASPAPGATGTLTFAAGLAGSQRIRVSITDDRLDEQSETVVLRLLNPSSGSQIPPSQLARRVSATITDSDTPVLMVSANTASVTEGASASFRIDSDIVPLDPGVYAANVTVAEIGASDFVANEFSEQEVTLTFGKGTTVFYDVPTIDRPGFNLPGGVRLTLHDNAGVDYTAGSPNSAAVIILNDDPQPVLIRAAQTEDVLEGDRVEFRLSSPFPAPPGGLVVTVNITDANGIIDGTARMTETIPEGLTSVLFGYDTQEDETQDVGGGTVTASIAADTRSPQVYTVVAGQGTASATVIDDDRSLVSIFPVTATITEGQSAGFRVRLSSAVDQTVLADITSSEGCTTETSRGVFIGGGDVEGAFSVTTINDNIDEADCFLVASLNSSNMGRAHPQHSSAVVTVRDNDPTASSSHNVRVTNGSRTVTEGAQVLFNVQISPQRSNDTVVTYSLTGTAEEGGDYSVVRSSLFNPNPHNLNRLIITGNQGAATLTLQLIDDTIRELDETLTFTITSVSEGAITGAAAAVTIRDDNSNDIPFFSIAAAGSGSAAEGNPASFILTASGAPASTLTVNVSVNNEAGDFLDGAARTEFVEFSSSQITRTLNLSTSGDDSYQEDGAIRATIASGSGYGIESAPDDTALFTIRNDDVPLITLEAPSSVFEGQPIPLTVRSDIDIENSMTVRVGGALNPPGSGFLSDTGPFEITILPGFRTATADVPTVNRRGQTDSAEFRAGVWCLESEFGCNTVVGGHPPNYNGTTPYSYAESTDLSVLDDAEKLISIMKIDPPTVSVRRELRSIAAGQTARFFVRAASRVPVGGLEIPVSITEDPADGVIDKTGGALPGTADINFGETSAVYTVPTSGATVGGSVTARLGANSAGHYTLGDSAETVFVESADAAIGVQASRMNVTEGETVSFSVTATALQSDVEVVLTIADVAGSDFVDDGAQTATFTFSSGGAATQRHDVTIKTDTTPEGDGVITATVATPGSTGFDLSPETVSVSVTDDDTERGLDVSLAPRAVSAGAATQITYTLTSSDTTRAFSNVGFTHSLIGSGGLLPAGGGSGSLAGSGMCAAPDGSESGTGAVSGGSLSVSGVVLGTVTGAAGNSSCEVTVNLGTEATLQPDEYSNLTSAATDSASSTEIGPAVRATLNVLMANPAVNITSISPRASEGGTLEFVTELSPELTSQVTVDYALTGTATHGAGADYTVASPAPGASGTLTFAPGETVQRVRLTLNADGIDELGESVVFTLSNPSGGGATLGSAVSTTGAILDNDSPALRIAAISSPVTEGANAAFRVTADIVPKSELNVKYTVDDGSDFVTEMNEGEQMTTLSFTPSAGTTATATFVVSTENDDADDADANVSATLALNDGEDYTLGSPVAASVEVQDNDPQDITLTITPDNARRNEGADVVFTITANPAPTENLTVNVLVTEAGGRAPGVISGTPPATAVIMASESTAQLIVLTARDGLDEFSSTVTATLQPGDYRFDETDSDPCHTGDNTRCASVSVFDQDNAAATISAPPTVVEGSPIEVVISLDTEAGSLNLNGNRSLIVAMTTEDASDFLQSGQDTEFTVTVDRTTLSYTFSVPTMVRGGSDSGTLTFRINDSPQGNSWRPGDPRFVTVLIEDEVVVGRARRFPSGRWPASGFLRTQTETTRRRPSPL